MAQLKDYFAYEYNKEGIMLCYAFHGREERDAWIEEAPQKRFVAWRRDLTLPQYQQAKWWTTRSIGA